MFSEASVDSSEVSFERSVEKRRRRTKVSGETLSTQLEFSVTFIYWFPIGSLDSVA